MTASPSGRAGPPAGPARTVALTLADALQRGARALSAGRLDEADKLYRAVLAASPGHPEALHHLGVVQAQRGRPADGLALVDRALVAEPDNAIAHSNRGNMLLALGRPADALAAYDRALAIAPGHAETAYNRGNALRRLDRQADALAAYDRAIELAPGYARAHCNRGNALQSLDRLDEALAAYDAALALDPDYPEAWYNRGNALRALSRIADRATGAMREREAQALAAYDRAVALRPDYVEALGNRGNALQALDRLGEALASYDRALALRPAYPEALNNRGNTLHAMNRNAEALECYARAIAARGDYGEALWNEAIARLAMGDLERGFSGYEWRWRNASLGLAPRPLPRPLWLGDRDVAGRTVLLWAEQGLGDTLQFCRYAAEVSARGARVVLEAQAPLLPLLAGLAGVERLVAAGDPLPEFDLHCPLLSLPLALGTRLDSVPANVPYLAPPPERIEAWRGRLPSAGGPRIGVVWSGSPGHRDDHHRSIPAPRLLAALQAAGATLVSLQKDLREGDDQAIARARALHFGDALGDYADTAALVSLVDLVVSVDTSVAHLAGALGTPVWILLPFCPDWRWLLERDDTPWYPTARLFRQPRPGDWHGVLASVSAAARTRFAAPR